MVRACRLRPVIKHIDAVELRFVVAAVLAVGADTVLVAQYILKLGARLVTALATSRGPTSAISAVVPVNIASSSVNDLAHRPLEVLL